MRNISTPSINSPRTIAQLHREMIATDPNCALTLSALRRLVRTNQIRSCRVGTKYLVTHAAVHDYLQGGTSQPNAAPPPGIRRADND